MCQRVYIWIVSGLVEEGEEESVGTVSSQEMFGQVFGCPHP